ncbi:MAG: hypothetical protein F4Y57_11230 [Acidobacteria bacterium]|nr:hypothetical protein [Acidobacteriota bacterium]
MMRAASSHGLSKVLMVSAAAVLAVAGVPSGAAAQADHEVTFTKDIAPILQRSCESCHRPRGGAPMNRRS